MESAGFRDSFRVRHPDPAAQPGHTWSTVQKQVREWNWTVQEPQDRIDFVFSKGGRVHVLDSFLYAGQQPLQPMPAHFDNDYPSDHFAVVSDFVIAQ